MMPSETEQAFEQILILPHEVTFRIHWNNIEGVTSPDRWELPHSALQAKYVMYDMIWYMIW